MFFDTPRARPVKVESYVSLDDHGAGFAFIDKDTYPLKKITLAGPVVILCGKGNDDTNPVEQSHANFWSMQHCFIISDHLSRSLPITSTALPNEPVPPEINSFLFLNIFFCLSALLLSYFS